MLEVTVAEVIEGVSEDDEDEAGLFQRAISRLEHRVEDGFEVGSTEDEAGLFQRPISRPEHRVDDRPEVNVTEIDFTEVEDSDSDTDTFHDAPEPDLFHDAPEQLEAMSPVDSNTNEAQGSSEVGAGITDTDTDTERIELEGDGSKANGSATRYDHSSAQQADTVERPPSRAQQIIERQPALTSEEIHGYDIEEDELRRRALSGTRRSNHASRY